MRATRPSPLIATLDSKEDEPGISPEVRANIVAHALKLSSFSEDSPDSPSGGQGMFTVRGDSKTGTVLSVRVLGVMKL